MYDVLFIFSTIYIYTEVVALYIKIWYIIIAHKKKVEVLSYKKRFFVRIRTECIGIIMSKLKKSLKTFNLRDMHII